LALLTLAPLLATEVDPWARMAVALAGAVTCVALALPGIAPPARRGLQFALLALPALLLGAWLGADAAAGRSRLVDFALCLIAFRAGRDLLGRAGRKWVLAGLTVVGGLTALRGLYQRWVSFPEALQTLAGSDAAEASVVALRIATGRIFSTFLLPSAFAGFLLLSLPLSLSVTLRRGVRNRWRWLALLSSVLQAVALFLTFSHGAFLSLAVALCILGVMVAGAGVRRAALVAAGVTVLLLLAVVLVRGEAFTGSSGETGPLSERLGNWQVAAAQIGAHPVAGVGWGAYGATYTRYQQPGMNQSHYVHNTYLQLLAEGGLLALPLLMAFAVWAVRRVRSLAPEERLLGLAALAVLLHNTLDFTLLLPGIAVPFFFVLASLAPRRGATAGAAGRAGAGRAAAVLLGLTVAGLTVTETLARRDFAQAQQLELQGRQEAAGAAIRSAVRWDPWNAGYRDFLARWLLQRRAGPDPAMLQEARGAAEQAIRLAPRRPRHHTTLELVCLAGGDRGCAFREAARAAALFPLSTEYQQRLQHYLPGETP
jgi:O-antigen ligase